jgi:chromatin segregation and condensation protein Rec8/ScpA/Scc1 (kleisin family)
LRIPSLPGRTIDLLEVVPRERRETLTRDLAAYQEQRRKLLDEWENIKSAEYRALEAAGRKVAEITRLFLEWLRSERTQESEAGHAADQGRVELGGDFIETASWLVLLKSRTLLPRVEAEEAPEAELRRVLLDHQTMRAAAALLGERLAEAGCAAGDPAAAAPLYKDTPAQESKAPTLADVLEAARRALLRAQSHGQNSVQGDRRPDPDLYTVEEQIATVRERIASLPCLYGISTEEWFEEQTAPEARVALLLALLELARVDEILLHQAVPLSPILLARTAA